MHQRKQRRHNNKAGDNENDSAGTGTTRQTNMVRILGIMGSGSGSGRNRQQQQQQQRGSRTKKKDHKRLVDTALTPQDIHEQHPMYEYALEEYAQAVPPGTSNDDGGGSSSGVVGGRLSASSSSSHPPPPLGSSDDGVGGSKSWMTVLSNDEEERRRRQQQQQQIGGGDEEDQQQAGGGVASGVKSSGLSSHQNPHPSSQQQQRPPNNIIHNNPTSRRRSGGGNHHHQSSHNTFEDYYMPDATYEETYGEAYTPGGTIKYVYPSGYQSMRPRSGPWKLSIFVCLLFTWLSVFVVGHCSDRSTNNYNNAAYEFDDDALQIDIRWCGSRFLYLMWVASMLITGISASYCGVIGYIQVRDFAVANARCQPPGIFHDNGKSDYYVRISDHFNKPSHASTIRQEQNQQQQQQQQHPQIYQADGSPQFWGSHIYRPTQAAVAVTSR